MLIDAFGTTAARNELAIIIGNVVALLSSHSKLRRVAIEFRVSMWGARPFFLVLCEDRVYSFPGGLSCPVKAEKTTPSPPPFFLSVFPQAARDVRESMAGISNNYGASGSYDKRDLE